MNTTTSSHVAFVDCETTGLDPDRNPIWEIAVIVDGVEHCWTQILPLSLKTSAPHQEFWTPAGAPSEYGLPIAEDGPVAALPAQKYISRWVLENTGITERYDHVTAEFPTRSVVRFGNLVSGRHLVGAVPSFDEERIRRLYRERINPLVTSYPWHYHLIDVEALMVGFIYGTDNLNRPSMPWKSDDLSREIGVEPPSGADRHSALGDARWAKAIYEKIMG